MLLNYLLQILFIFPFVMLVYRQVSSISLKWYEYGIIFFTFVFSDLSFFYLLFLEIAVLIFFSYHKDQTKPIELHIFYGLYPWIMDSLLRRFVFFYILPVFGVESSKLFSENISVLAVTELFVYIIYFSSTYHLRFNFDILVEMVGTKIFRRRVSILDLSMFIYFYAMEFFSGVDYYGHINTLIMRKILTIVYFCIFITSIAFINMKYNKYIEDELTKVRLSELEVLLTYTKKIEELYNDIRAFRHDYANIMSTLNEGIIHNDMQSIRNVYQTIIKESDSLLKRSKYEFEGLTYIKDDAIKSLIATKIFEAKKRGVEVQLDIPEEIEKPDNISLLDFIRLISILLDNAIEATIRSEFPKLILNIYTDDSIYYLIVINSTKEKAIPIEYLTGNGYTTKEGSNHGIGLTTMKQMKMKYPQLNVETTSNQYNVIQKIKIMVE